MKNLAYQVQLYLQRKSYPGSDENTPSNVGGDKSGMHIRWGMKHSWGFKGDTLGIEIQAKC